MHVASLPSQLYMPCCWTQWQHVAALHAGARGAGGAGLQAPQQLSGGQPVKPAQPYLQPALLVKDKKVSIKTKIKLAFIECD